MKKLTILILILITLLSLLPGCSPDSGGKAPAGVKTDSPEESPLECDWVLKVDQTIPITTDELTVNYTLVLIAQKTGGTDVYGTYEGAAYIGSELDASNLSNEFFDVIGGFDINAFANNLSFELVPYDKEEYSRYGIAENEPSLVPLVEYESMALISPEMTGSGVINPNITGENVNAGYNDFASGTAPIVMKITVNSGKVQVYVPSLNMDRSFEGLLTGEPLGSDTYQQAIKKIEDLQTESEPADTPSEDDFGGLGGILGTMGTNLPLPASFPADDFPLASDANIINVYENEDKTNVRVMFGTGMAYEDLLEFYAPVIDKLDTKIDMDDGVMYMGDSGKYKSIMLMIMKDKSKTYTSMVSIEITKK